MKLHGSGFQGLSLCSDLPTLIASVNMFTSSVGFTVVTARPLVHVETHWWSGANLRAQGCKHNFLDSVLNTLAGLSLSLNKEHCHSFENDSYEE